MSSDSPARMEIFSGLVNGSFFIFLIFIFRPMTRTRIRNFVVVLFDPLGLMDGRVTDKQSSQVFGKWKSSWIMLNGGFECIIVAANYDLKFSL